MSLLTLLVDFPNYSARKVRRLAKQIALLQQAAEHADEPSVARGIEADLMEYNLLQAKTEAQLNDDVSLPGPAAIAVSEERVTENICVTPVEAARRALDEMANYAKINSDITVNREGLDKVWRKCHGIINGQSFYTDRSFIQAKLSPQEKLPLNGEAS